MGMAELGAVIGVLVGLSTIAGILNKKIKDASDGTREVIKASIESVNTLHRSEMKSNRRSIEDIKDDIDSINVELAKHSHKISQSDVVMVHLDETIKQLGSSVLKLDETLGTLQIVVAKIGDNN